MMVARNTDEELEKKVAEALTATRGIHIRTIAVFSSLILYGFGLIWYASDLNSTIRLHTTILTKLETTDVTLAEKLDQSRDAQTRMQAQTDANKEKINQLSDIKVVIESLKGEISLLRKEVSLHSDDVQHVLKKTTGGNEQ